MKRYQPDISEDEAVVLFEFFARFDETDQLVFLHPAEYLALLRISAQIDKTTAAMFDPDYERILADARNRIASGFEGKVPGLDSDA